MPLLDLFRDLMFLFCSKDTHGDKINNGVTKLKSDSNTESLETKLNENNGLLKEKEHTHKPANTEAKLKPKVRETIKTIAKNFTLDFFCFQEKDNVLKPKIRLVQGNTGKVLKTTKQKKRADLKKKIKKQNKMKKKKNGSQAVDGNQDTLSRITQELPKYNWLEEKIKNGETSNPPSTPTTR